MSELVEKTERSSSKEIPHYVRDDRRFQERGEKREATLSPLFFLFSPHVRRHSERSTRSVRSRGICLLLTVL